MSAVTVNMSFSTCVFVCVADISSIKDLSLRVKELGTKARLYEPSLAKASGHLQRLGAENDKERSGFSLAYRLCCSFSSRLSVVD